jgi:hypothetical protein
MVNFSQLKELEVSSDETVDYCIYQIEGEPMLSLLPASESNKSYFSALLRKSRSKVRAIKSAKLSPGMIKDNRDEDRELYSQHIIKGWDGVVDSDGKTVPFTTDNVEDFLNALPDWIFEDIRNFASDIQNFISEPIETEVIAKN